MDPMLLAIGVVMGFLGGLIHQLIDSEQENTAKDMARGIALGCIAGLFTPMIMPVSGNMLYIMPFVNGYFGDSVILNIIRRYSI